MKKPVPDSPVGLVPYFEKVVTDESETFLWRCDDYPWIRNVWHIHPEYEIHLVRNADGVSLVGDHIGQFSPGYLAIVGGGLPHHWVTPLPPGEVIHKRDIVIQFDPLRLRQAATALPELARLEPFFGRALRGLSFSGRTRRAAADLMEQIGSADSVARLSTFLELLHLLSSSNEFSTLSSEGFAPRLNAETLDLTQRCLKHIFDHFAEDIRMSEIAAMFDMKESAFSKFFKKNIGNSFVDYVAKLRIGRACKLLAETDTPVTEVCFQVGYLNISNFNRVFRTQRGLTPSEYRRLAKQRVS